MPNNGGRIVGFGIYIQRVVAQLELAGPRRVYTGLDTKIYINRMVNYNESKCVERKPATLQLLHNEKFQILKPQKSALLNNRPELVTK